MNQQKDQHNMLCSEEDHVRRRYWVRCSAPGITARRTGGMERDGFFKETWPKVQPRLYRSDVGCRTVRGDKHQAGKHIKKVNIFILCIRVDI